MIPKTVSTGGRIVSAQGLLAVSAGCVYIYRAIGGHKEETVVIDSWGTALLFFILGGALLAAGIGLIRGQRWGRGLSIYAQLLLLPVAWYVGVGSGHILPGIAVAAVAITCIVLLLSPTAVHWYTDGDNA